VPTSSSRHPSRHTGTIRDRTATSSHLLPDYWRDIMRIWLGHDPVALALLVIGLAAVELLAFILSLIM
jgi:hypothetical protein